MNLSDLGALVDSGAIEVSTHPNDLRFAGDKLNEQIVKEILTPWHHLEKDKTRPNYEGRNANEWLADNERIKEVLINNPKDRIDILKANGFGEHEAKLIIRDIVNKPNASLRPSRFLSAHAKADEDVNRAVLHYSGYAPVKEGNTNNSQGTDLSMTLPGGKKVMVDSQVRNTPDGLNLGIVSSNPYIYEAIRENPNMPLIELLTQAVESGDYILEDKLLQTANTDFNPIQSKFIKDRDGVVQEGNLKDFIISSNRFDSRRLKGKQPYNREKAWGYDLIDLNRAREILLPKSYNQLRTFTGNSRPLTSKGEKNTLLINLPNELIQRELTNRAVPIDKDVARLFTGGRRVMVRP